MAASASGRIWDDASAPPATRLVRRFEDDWAASQPGRRPDPADYLPDDPAAHPAARLALLRAELALCREAGEPIRVEAYRDRFPDLGSETLVALVYEEFCLREDAGETPEPAEYLDRFPEIAEGLRRVLDIHDLVGSARTVSLPMGPAAPTAPAFPEVGQTIGGFHLVAELGRGSFARVFRARERQLADRPVSLKVSRAGSREPQMLARLQHTHIVPVHSYRTDPVSSLHLLGMPYLGQVTLEQLLADPQVRAAREGRDLLAALDRLGEGADFAPDLQAVARRELARRPYARAVAWWAARMAEALQHAHERGVLHRDIKPSNVLVTGDGLPMLLDFNLAWETRIDEPGAGAAALGGTLVYMAPEHLEAVAEGHASGIDARSDIYSLGVLLYEAMGTRPFAPPEGGRSVVESLLREADRRRLGPPPLRERFPSVPPEFEAVILRCLAPEPADRYPDAAALAADLQAVADDAPLRLAREPLGSRSVRWLRRNRCRLAVAGPLVLALSAIVSGLTLARLERARVTGELVGRVKRLIQEGNDLVQEGRIEAAEARFSTAQELTANARDDTLRTLQAKARDKSYYALEIARLRTAAGALLDRADSLKLRLLGFTGDVGDPSAEVEATLAPFYVLSDEVLWTERPDLTLLDPGLRTRLLEEVDTLLFLWAIALDDQGGPAALDRALEVCARVQATTDAPGPWDALRQRIENHRAGRTARPVSHPAPAGESARACFLRGVLEVHQARLRQSIPWLTRATRLAADAYWYHYYLGYVTQRTGDNAQALGHYDVAIALRPERPWPRFNRARLYQAMGAWDRAREDLDAALERSEGAAQRPVRLNLGLLFESLGDLAAARAEYEAVLVGAAPDDPFARAARLNRARLDVEEGAIGGALAGYESLLAEDPTDATARQGRALVLLRQGRPAEALADLDALELSGTDAATRHAYRAQALLPLGRAGEALDEAEAALRLDPTPARERLRVRCALAAGRVDRLRLERPEDLLALPRGGATLWTDLRAAADRLADSESVADLLNLAVLRSALGEDAAAEDAASRALVQAPGSAKGHLVRARVRRHSGDTAGALFDIEKGLALEPNDPRFLALRGLLRTEAGDAAGGLADLDRAARLGAGPGTHHFRAQALMALGRPEAALAEWTAALDDDPESAGAYLGRAGAFLALGLRDHARAELERAAAWAGPRPVLLARITLAYARLLPGRPDRLRRVLALARRTLAAAVPATSSSGAS